MIRRHRIAQPLIFVALFGSAISTASCGADPVGVEACREIESARCEAAVKCGLVDDLAGCNRYFRDHCLHGVATEDAPGGVAVDRCVDTLNRAGRCAERHGTDADPSECDESRFADADAENICELVEEPERASRCEFLKPPDEDFDDDDDSADDDSDDSAAADAGSK